MDTGDQDFMDKLLKDMETFLESTIGDVQLSQVAEDSRKDLLKQIQDCRQYVLNLPQEYVDMTRGAITDDSFSDSGSLLGEKEHETSSMIEPVEYENGDGLFLPGNKEEDNLNLADINPPSASELKAMSQKYGPLQRKDRFMFMDQMRNFWAALHANKLYFYSNEREAKPQNWICIDGYTAKSAPNAVRDSKKKPLCFEVICPANKKLQFIASSPNDMEQWVAAINKGSGSSSNIRSPDTTIPDEDNTSTYEDVDLICASLQGESGSLHGAQNENRTVPRRGEDDAIYNDIDSAFNANITIPQDIYDDTDSSKKFDEAIYDDVDALRSLIRNKF